MNYIAFGIFISLGFSCYIFSMEEATRRADEHSSIPLTLYQSGQLIPEEQPLEEDNSFLNIPICQSSRACIIITSCVTIGSIGAIVLFWVIK